MEFVVGKIVKNKIIPPTRYKYSKKIDNMVMMMKVYCTKKNFVHTGKGIIGTCQYCKNDTIIHIKKFEKQWEKILQKKGGEALQKICIICTNCIKFKVCNNHSKLLH